MHQGRLGSVHSTVDILGTGSLDGGNGLVGAIRMVSLMKVLQLFVMTYAGSMEVMVWPPVAGTISLLIKSPVGCL